MMKRCILLLLLVLLMRSTAFSQQTPSEEGESHKYRTIMTITGTGGGFAGGVLLGIALFDDAVNSDRKVWTTAIVGAAAGGVGGYFIGRALDQRKRRTTSLTISIAASELQISPLLGLRTAGVHFGLTF
jgi:hypothetical protein